jgi:hypothetical protein
LIWVVLGVLWILVSAAVLVGMVLYGGIAMGIAVLGGFGSIIIFGLAKVGLSTLSGNARDTQANGFGSLGIGLFFAACGLFTFGYLPMEKSASNGLTVTLLVVSNVCGVLFAAAGVLALLGRQQYLEYRQALRSRTDRSAVTRT